MSSCLNSATASPPAHVESALIVAMRGMGATIGEPIPCDAALSVIAECMRAGMSCATCERNPANFGKQDAGADLAM